MVRRASSDQIIAWLVTNAKRMTEDMFSEPGLDSWDCDAIQTLLLRAYAPEDVFTEDAGERYLELVAGNEELEELCDALFGDDDDLTGCLPESVSMLEDFLRTCQEDAYQRGIR